MGGVSSTSTSLYAGGIARSYETSLVSNTPAAASGNASRSTSIEGPARAGNCYPVLAASASVAAGFESGGAGTQQPMLSSEDLIGLALLLLTLEWMRSDSEDDKKGLLELMSLLGQQLNSSRGQGMLLNSYSSLSITSTQITAVVMNNAISAYGDGAAAADSQPAPAADAAAGGLDVLA